MSVRPLALSAGLVVALAVGRAPRLAVAQPRDAGAGRADAAESFVHDSWTVQDGLPVKGRR